MVAAFSPIVCNVNMMTAVLQRWAEQAGREEVGAILVNARGYLSLPSDVMMVETTLREVIHELILLVSEFSELHTSKQPNHLTKSVVEQKIASKFDNSVWATYCTGDLFQSKVRNTVKKKEKKKVSCIKVGVLKGTKKTRLLAAGVL